MSFLVGSVRSFGLELRMRMRGCCVFLMKLLTEEISLVSL